MRTRSLLLPLLLLALFTTPTPGAPPTLGNYANTTVSLSGSTTITPTAAPTNAVSATAATVAAFKGELEVDPTTGVVRVTNAHPANRAGEFYPVTVTAYNADGTTTRTFNLTVTTPAGCNAFVPLSLAATDISFGGNQSVAVGDFNGDGKQDIVTANSNSSVASVLLRNAANTGFDAKVDYTVGSSPVSVAVADFNGDGKEDVVTANSTNHNVSVLLRNAANNGFDAAVNFVTGTTPVSVAVGDFNGDGRPDIVTANNGSGVFTVSVLLRNAANNGFDPKVDVAVNNRPVSVTVADFNGDGKQDIVAVNNQSTGVASVLLRNAANTGFDAKVDFTVGFNSQAVVAGDFNGDGKQDIATANSFSNNVSVLLRNAANTGFDAKVDYATDVNPVKLAVGDFNHDGRQDIVTANSGSGGTFNNISVLLRNAANNGFDAKVDFNAGTSSVAAVAVGDFNGDNRQDITALNTGNVRIYVLERVCNNAPGFTGVTNQVRAQGASSNSQIATVSDPETAAGSLTVTATTVPPGITVSSIVNTNGTITATVGAGGGTPTGDYTVVLTVSDGELTANANLTVTIVSPTQEIVVKGSNLIITDGDTTPSVADNTDFGQVALAITRERTFTIENVGATALTIGTVSVTGGQAAAFTVTQQPAASIPLFGTTTFKIRAAPTTLGVQSTTVTFANNDADENPFNFTVQATGITAATLGDYANTSILLGSNTTITPTAAPTNQTYATATTTSDFKGRLEVDPTTGVVRVTNAHPANRVGETYLVTVRAYNAGGSTTETFDLTVTTPTGCSTFNAAAFAASSYSATARGYPAVGDFNGDGRQDIVFANTTSSATQISVLTRNAANTGFDPSVNLTTGTFPNSVGVGDFNGDGKADIAAANFTSNTVSVLLRNAANTGFDPKVDYAVGNGPAGLAVGDFNGDGKPDIAATNFSDNTVSVLLRNEANDGFGAAVPYVTGTSPSKVAVGDFNGDGKSDLVVANYGTGVNNVSVLLRNAANDGFEAKIDYAVTNRPNGVAVGDFNGDGKLDIVSTNSGSGTGQNMVSVLLRNAANTGFDAAVNYIAGIFSFAVAVGDFNHDGKQDIAASTQSPGSVAVLLRNAANNGFDAKVDFGSSNGQAVAVGDFNGDNRQDIVTGNTTVGILQRVCDNAPTFTSVTNQTRLQGVSSNSQIAVVNDAETAPGSLTVTAPTVPSGITVSNIVNTSGNVTADVGAAVNTPAGDYTVVLSAFDGENATNANLTVTVTPIAQEVVVRGNNVIITDGDTTPSLADHTDFGSVALANTRERTFTIQNIGANPLTIQTVTVSGGQPAAFSVTQQPASSIPGNGSTTFKVSFAPTALGPQSTTVNFVNNDGDENPFDFTIQATAIAAPTLGNYANTTIPLSGNATVTPTAAPTNQTYATATTTADFKGELEVDPTTGLVRVTNAHPANRAGESYAVTVTAYNAGGATTKTFNLTVTTPATCPFLDATTFAPVVNYALPFGANPNSTAIGDFNADGKQDMVTNSAGNMAVFLRNAANNGFDAPVTYSAGFNPRVGAVGDFNADGKQDVVVTPGGSGNTVVSVLLRNAGNTGFDAKIDYPAGSNAVLVAVGDFNADRRQDIVASNSGGAVSVLLRNQANDGFDSPVSYTVGTNSGALAIGDFNGDGRQDIVVTNTPGNTVAVLLRNAANDGFEAAASYTVGDTPQSVVVGDFNADGKPDIAAANNGFGANSVSVLLRNAANNGFDAAVTLNIGVQTGAVGVGDFNHDGKQDIAVTNANGSSVSVLLRNAANNGFEAKIDLAVASGPNSIAIGDFNADNKQDIVTSNGSNNLLSVLERANCPPIITPTIGLTKQQGSPAAISQIAVVEDFETPAGNLTVQATTVPAGITVSNIVNNNGTITANIAASCTATTGNNTVVLTATDAASASTNANLIVNVTANTPPTLTYPNASVTVNGSTTVNLSSAVDNGGIVLFALQSQGTYTGTISVNSANGAVSISSAAPAGAHTITIRATDNCTAITDASFTLTVNQPPAITSANNTTFTVGTAGSFTVTTTGSPPAGISRTGALPAGVTFTDNGNGTATLAGTAAAGTGGSYPLTITAQNGVLPNATQNFTLTVNQAPAFTSANSTTFTLGAAGSFTVTTSAFPQVTTITRTGTLPSGVTFTNNGNGTATIAGTPAAGTSGNYPLTFGAANGIPPNATQNFALTVGTPEIAVEQPAGQGLLDGTSSVSFGSVNPGANNSLTFIVRNIGTAPLTGLGITFDGANLGDFSVTSAPTAPVAPGGSTMFTVRFAPTAAGTRAAALHIASNDADENTFDVGLTGSRYTNLEAWRVLHFGSPDNSGDGANGNDFDFDGLSNLFEFATGSHPKQSSQWPGVLILNGSAMEFHYTRAAGAIADGLIFQVKFSDTLTGASWSISGVTDDPIGGDETQRRAAVSQGSSGRRFLRLEVALPSP